MIEPTKAKDMYQTTKVMHIEGFKIPQGFPFDGMSAPWALRSFVGGPYRPRMVEAVILHDFLYLTKRVKRKEADLIFKKMLKDGGVKGYYLFYIAVRAFGWMRYR